MIRIKLHTKIQAPIERIFNLARSIDFHKVSMNETKEEVIAGRVKGLIELGESVTWRAKHFGIYQKLKVKIVDFKRNEMFKDVMIQGAFKKMEHIHRFRNENGITIMIDEFEFESPFGFLGKIVDNFVLKNYMTQLLEKRNEELKLAAEGNGWKKILNTKYIF
ncbi:MAG: SRPBCC family protein [Flavobacteriales bacterium]|nr:SRPBCC family protein [Flavobacteriales bacterium]